MIKFSLNIFLLTFFLYTINMSAQVSYLEMMDDYDYNFYEVVEAAEQYFSNHSKGKGSGYKQYLRWKYENEGRYFPSGVRSNIDHGISIKAHNQYVKNLSSQVKKSNSVTWQELGPYYSEDIQSLSELRVNGAGRVESFWVNPNNDNELYLSSKSGGFWKSSDGGNSWTNTTDNLFSSGVGTIAVNPFNFDEILIGVQNPKNYNSQGIYRSTDRGNTWSPTNFNPENIGIGGFGKIDYLDNIKYHPLIPNLVFIATNKGLFKSNNNLDEIDPPFYPTKRFSDIEFHPTANKIIYALDQSSTFIYVSDDAGFSFDPSTSIPNSNFSGQQIAVSHAEPNSIWYASTGGIWKSLNRGQTFEFLGTPLQSMSEFAVSDIQPDSMIWGYVDAYTFNSEGTIVRTTKWTGSNNNKYIHADLRALESINGVFYAGTDGFLAKSNDNGSNWQRLNERGTSIRENYHVAVTQSNNEIFMVACQDNGTAVYNHGVWDEIEGGDGTQCIMHPLNSQWLIMSHQRGTKTFVNDLNTRISANTIGIGHNPLFYDHLDPMTVFSVDKNQIYKAQMHVLDFKAIGNHDITNYPSPHTADISYQNSDIMIMANYYTLKLSTDKGQSWTDITNGLPIGNISRIKINPNNDNEFIVTSNNYEIGEDKIFITRDRGNCWKNISYNLEYMPILSVVIDHTPQQNIYVGTELGIFTMPINGTSWTKYSNGLPNVAIEDMEIHYGSNELFAATWGRGTWKVDLVGREHHPKITKTSITDGPTDALPLSGSNQLVTASIEYAGTLTHVNVLWSEASPTFDRVITMSNTNGNTWVSNGTLPSQCAGQKIYFKVVAVGNNVDVSETYKFMYRVKSETPVVPGDVNNDGVVNILDALNISQYAVGLRTCGSCGESPIPNDELCTMYADYNGDGDINILDAYVAARCVVGFEENCAD